MPTIDKNNIDTTELLVELYSEEIPWRMQEPMARSLEKLLFSELLHALGFPKTTQAKDAFGEHRLYWTPRRIAIAIDGVPKKSIAWQEERKGPRVASPQVAIDGFMRKNGIKSLDECIKKGGYYAVNIEHKAVATSELLGELVSSVIDKMQKELKVSMRFAKQNFRWVRPLRHILVVFAGGSIKGYINLGNGEKLDFTDKTLGHPLAKPEPFAVTSMADYESKLRASYVEPIYTERLQIIKEAVGDVINNQQVVIKENACLTEYPSVLKGYFNEEFLPLPFLLIQTILNHHQKIIYNIAITDKVCNFYFVANVSSATDKKKVIKGVERVVRARLADAKFMFERDNKIPISEHIKKLEHITFHPKLGSIAAKNSRVKKLVSITIEELKKHNSKLCIRKERDHIWFSKLVDIKKSDLATETIREFPNLQGKIMGKKKLENFDGPYALDEDLNFLSDTVENRVSRLADNVDSLVSLWLVGERATGSGDPFFLRRYAFDILNDIMFSYSPEDNYSLPLRSIFAEAVQIVGEQKNLETQNDFINIILFMLERMRQWVSDKYKDIRADCIEAIIYDYGVGNQTDKDCNILKILNYIKILNGEMNKNNHLSEIFYRLQAILPVSKNMYLKYQAPDESLFEKPEEKALFACSKDIIMESDTWRALSFKQKLESLASLKDVLDTFFDKVMVNAEDEAVRENRLNLLYGIYRRFGELANFRKIHHKDTQQKGKNQSQQQDKIQSHA